MSVGVNIRGSDGFDPDPLTLRKHNFNSLSRCLPSGFGQVSSLKLKLISACEV